MKILQVNNYNSHHGGANIYYRELCALLQSNYEVLQCFSSKSGKPTDRFDFILSELNITNVGMDSLRYFYRANESKSFRDYLSHHKPDIAHIHIFQGQISWSLLHQIKLSGIPIVQTLHDLKIICPTGYAVRNKTFCNSCLESTINCLRFRCNRGQFFRSMHSAIDFKVGGFFGYPEMIDHFICVSDYQRNIVLNLIEKDKVSVVHNFSKSKSFAIEPKKIIDGEYLFYPTRLVEHKGIEELIKIYIADHNCELPRVVVAGDGECRDRFQRYVDQYGLSDRICFYGHAAGSTLDSLYQNSICVFNLSQLNETFGLTSIEAFSHGKRIIVSKNGALPEIVNSMNKGFVIDSFDNYTVIKNDIVNFLREVSMNNNSESLVKYHFDHFSPSKHLDQIVNVYDKVVNL